ncbi:Hypothetical predicted protein [Drosophila guanche]|uniref:Uncharacterized protein n=1 Tax=Drosophila guanche TaxID=7266 RepID=A0A3B0L0D4_DROGU|nr:Hypothetical predicted protein [Drosophila guanche]
MNTEWSPLPLLCFFVVTVVCWLLAAASRKHTRRRQLQKIKDSIVAERNLTRRFTLLCLESARHKPGIPGLERQLEWMSRSLLKIRCDIMDEVLDVELNC